MVRSSLCIASLYAFTYFVYLVTCTHTLLCLRFIRGAIPCLLEPFTILATSRPSIGYEKGRGTLILAVDLFLRGTGLVFGYIALLALYWSSFPLA